MALQEKYLFRATRRTWSDDDGYNICDVISVMKVTFVSLINISQTRTIASYLYSTGNDGNGNTVVQMAALYKILQSSLRGTFNWLFTSWLCQQIKKSPIF